MILNVKNAIKNVKLVTEVMTITVNPVTMVDISQTINVKLLARPEPTHTMNKECVTNVTLLANHVLVQITMNVQPVMMDISFLEKLVQKLFLMDITGILTPTKLNYVTLLVLFVMVEMTINVMLVLKVSS